MSTHPWAVPHFCLFFFLLCLLFCVAFSSETPDCPECQCPDVSIVEAKLSACDTKTVQLTQDIEKAAIDAESHQQSIKSAQASTAQKAEELARLQKELARLQKENAELARLQKENAELDATAKQCMSRAKELTTSLEAAKTEAARALSEAASSKKDTDGLTALREERDALQTSRLQLASELETTKGALTTANSAKSDLQQTIDTILKPQVDELVNCKKSKASLKQALEKSETTSKSQVSETRKAAQIEKEKLSAELKVLKEKEDLTLFSAKRLYDAFNRFQIFTRCLGRYVADNVCRVARKHVPEEWVAVVRQKWQENVTANWNAKVVPAVSNMYRKLRTSEVTTMSVAIYYKNIHPHWTKMLKQTRETAGSALMPIRAYSISYVQMANDYISSFVVTPITRQFPEMQQLVPTSFVDRLCCLAYVYFVYLHVLRHGWFVVKNCMAIVFFPLKVLLPCIFRRSSSESGTGKKAKRHRPKTFQPAAMTNAPKGKDNSQIAKDGPAQKENQTARKKGQKV